MHVQGAQEYRLLCLSIWVQIALLINMVSTKVGGNIEIHLILSRRLSWAVGLNSRLSGMANMALVFLLHPDLLKPYSSPLCNGWFSRVRVISSSSVVSYPDDDELVWDGDRDILACSLIFVTGGTLLSVSPLQSIISPEECLTSFNSFRIWWSWGTPPDTWHFDLINTVVAYFVVCYATRTAQVTARHVPWCFRKKIDCFLFKLY